MSTLSLRKKLQRSRPESQSTKGQRTLRKIRKYAPWVAAICVGAYLPPKVMSSVWKVDADGAWNTPGPTGNWTNGIVPNNNGQSADFVLDFTANRTISLVGPPAIAPVVSSVKFDDTNPSSVLTILGDGTSNGKLLAKGGLTFDVSKGNTLLLSSGVVTNDVLGTTDGSGITKIGTGLLSINGLASYSGPTTLTKGVLVATTLANGSLNSSIGISSKLAGNLVFNGGVLRYVAPAATNAPAFTDRSFTLNPIPVDGTKSSGTIDSSSPTAAASLIFGTTFTVVAAPLSPSGSVNVLAGAGAGPTIVSSDGDRILTLRGTNVGSNSTLVTGVNEIQATITDFGNPTGAATGYHTSVVKLDTGTWRLSAALLPATNSATDGFPLSAVYDQTKPATWLGQLTYGNTYTGDTIVQRGILQLEFAPLPLNFSQSGATTVNTNNFQYASAVQLEKHLGVINPRATQPAAVLPGLQLGSPAGSGQPGGGTLEILGGSVQRNQNAPDGAGKFYVNYSGAIQDFGTVTINSGANTIDRIAFSGGLNTAVPAVVTGVNGTSNSEFVYIPDANNLIHNSGGTLNITGLNPDSVAAPVVKIGPVLPNYVNGILNGWVHRDDNWVLPTQNPTDVPISTNTISLNYHTPYSLVGLASYTGANDVNGATVLVPNSNVIQNSLFTQAFSNGSSATAGNQRFINSLKFDATLAANFPNKQFRISDGDDPAGIDFGSPPTVMAISTGGLLAASSNGLTQIFGGRITSGSGDFTIDASNPQNPVFINRGGGTLGRSEIFAIVRSPASAPLYLSSGIVDYYSQYDPSNRLSVGLTKSGNGTLILLDSTSTGLKGAARSSYQGDTYINEGTLVIRADSALGATIDYPGFFTDPETGQDSPPNYNADGTHGQTYLLGTTSVLDFQGVRYTMPEKINVNQGEIQATIGRSTFNGVITNLNEEQKAVLRVGTYLELIGDPSTNGVALAGVGGIQKLGNGLLVVTGDTVLGVDANGVASTSEFPGSGDIQLDFGNSVWNGAIALTNGSINAISTLLNSSNNIIPGQHSFNGPISITNGHLVNANSTVAFTKAGQVFTVELQQSQAANGATQTIFGNLNQLPADGAQVYKGLITVGTVTNGVSVPGGGITIIGSIDFGTSTVPNPLDLTRGTLAQISTINSGYVPTTRFYGPVTFGLAVSPTIAGTVSLYHNTLFNSSLTLGQATSPVNLIANGIGHTTFAGAVNVVNGNLTLTDSSFTLPYTQALGTLTLNGVDTFNNGGSGSALTITGGTVVEQGTRRAVGVYSPRNVFNGDLTIAPPAALNSTLAMTFSSNNDVEGNINITGAAPLPGITLQRVDVRFANGQALGVNAPLTTGSLIVTGGQVTIASSGALGAGTTGTPGTAGGVGGVTLQGEKSVLNFVLGVATAPNEDITIGASATAYLSGVAITNYGNGTYLSGTPTITISGGGASLQATGTATLTGTALTSIGLTGVGTGYTAPAGATLASPTIGQSSGNGTFAPVYGGAVIRGLDQHNVIDGSIILNNVTAGRVNLGVPMLSVGQDDTLQIKGDIFGTTTVTQANSTVYVAANPIPAGQLNGRFMTTAILGGGALNSSSGIIILSGQVKDTSGGAVAVGLAGTPSNILNTEWVGSNDLNIQVEKPWNANGLIQMAQGVMRYTNTTAGASFFANNTPNFALSVPNTSFGHASLGFNSVTGNGIQTAAFFLTQPGQIFNAPAFSVYLGNSNKVALDGSSTGFVSIGGENTTGTVTYGNHTGNITLDVDVSASGGALRDLRLFANAGGTVDIQNAFVKTGSNGIVSIDKVGDGTVWLSGAATAAFPAPAGVASALDRVYVLGGTLELRNFGQFTAQRLSSNSAQLTLGGGTLRLFTGAATGSVGATGTVLQSVTGNVFIRNGLSSVQVQSGGQASTMAIGSGGITVNRAVAGVVNFDVTGVGANITLNANTGILRGSANPLFWATYGMSTDPTNAAVATNFAFSDTSANGSAILPYASATTSDDLSSFAVGTANIQEAGTTGFVNKLKASYLTANTVRFSGTATGVGGNLDLNGQTITLGVGTTTPGAILLSSNANGSNRVISNGTIIPAGTAAANDIVLLNWGGDGTTAPKLTVSAILANNPALLAGNIPQDNPVTIAGDGTTVLTGANTFRGSVYLSGGTLEVASAAPLGADSANLAKNLFLDGGTLHNTGDFTWTNRNIVVYGDRSTIKIDSGKTFLMVGTATGGGINSQSPEVITANNIAYGSASSAVSSGTNNIWEGDLVISGGASGATAGGTFVQVRDNVANTIAGQVFVTGNGRLAFEGNNFGWLGNNLSWMDGTTVASGSTLEVRPTVNTVSAATSVGEWLHLNGAGQPGAGGALVMKRPSAVIGGIFVNAAAALTDHTLSWTGPVTMDGPTTIFVDDSPEVTVAGQVGQLTFDDNLFDGGTTNLLTKTGAGILRFNNSRIQNLGSILVSTGEVRFEGGILGTIGSEANKTANGLLHTGSGLAPSVSFNNFTSGTNSITVGTGASGTFATGARLAFVNVPGTHNADIALNNGFLYVQSQDAPLQATSFAGDFTLTGTSAANAIEATYTTRVNPIVMFGAFIGTGGFTKFGPNEIDFVNPNSSFSGEILVARGGGSITSPGVGLFDAGAFTNVSSIKLTNDASFFLDNRHSLDASTGVNGNDNQNNRINDNAAINLGGASRLRLIGNANASTFETVGVLNVHLGSSAVAFDPASTTQNIGMSFQNYTRDQGGVVNFRVLKTGVDFGTGVDQFGTPETTGAATITVRGNVAASLFQGGAGLDRLGGSDPQSTSILVGAFGSVVTRNYSTLPTNVSVSIGTNNNDQPFAGRGMMTIESVTDTNNVVTKYLRPLRDSEYLNATRVGIRVTDSYDFDALFTRGAEDPFNPGNFPDIANGTHKNVRLIGGFGPSTSAIAESLFATEGNFLFGQRDDSRKQDSLYRVLADVTFNSLTFAQQTTEIVDGGGNRIILEISPDKTLTVGSGMVLAAGLGVIGAAAPNVNFNSTQASLIRGGTLQFGAQEAIIQNVAAGLNETTGLFTSNRLVASSPIANQNISASDLTISSTIAGLAGLTKSGPSTVNLSGANTYSGTTNVTEGILRLENNLALGNSHLVVVSGTGELRMQRGITVGDPANPHALQVQFASVAQPAAFRAEAGNNFFYGDIAINTLNDAGDRFVTAAIPYDVSIINGTGSAFALGGDIYGVNTAGGGINPLNDVQRGRQARIVNFQNQITPAPTVAVPNPFTTGGVIQIRGSFRDLQSGSVTGLVQSDNEEQVLRSAITGSSNSNVFVYSSWDSAGSILLRQGMLRLTGGLPGVPVTDFFTKAASNAINPLNAQAHPIIGDQTGLSGLTGDVTLTLTTAGQDFNSPTLQIINNGTTSNVTIGGENTTGTIKFFAPSASDLASNQFNDATRRISSWDRNVRLLAAPGGTVEIDGKITDNPLNNNGSITKVGSGTVIMSGMDGATAGYVNGTSNINDFDKGINVAAGKLVLDSNVASNTVVANIWGGPTTQLTLAGGKLEIRGDTDTGVRALDVWNNTVTIRNGSSEIALVPNTGTANAGLITLTLGAANSQTTRSTGGTVNFATPGSADVISYLSNAGSVQASNGVILGPWATFGASPGTATDFAATVTGDATRSVVGFGSLPTANYKTSNDPSTFNSGDFANEAASGFNSSLLNNNVKLIRFGAPAITSTLNLRGTPALGGGITLGNNATAGVDEGAILVPTGTTALKTITGGDFQVNGGKELFLFNYGTGGLNVPAAVIGATSIVLSGPGTTTLGRNKQTGNVYLNEGVTSIDKLNVEPASFGVAAATAGQTTFTIGSTVGVRTGSPVTDFAGNSLGTVLNINGNQITTSAGAVAGANVLVITPTTVVTTAANLTAVTSGTQGIVQTNGATLASLNVAGLTVGSAVSGTGVPFGTTVTAISITGAAGTFTETLTFSQALSSSQALSFAIPNGLGLASSASTGLNMNGGTLQYTGNTVQTDRNVAIADAGATFEVTQAGTSMQIGTLVTTATVGGPSGNPNGGGLIKTGPGTLIVSGASGANTYTGMTDVKAGTLTFQNATLLNGIAGGPLGSSTNMLDGTVVRTGGTLRMQLAADLTTQEWFTFENNSTVDFAPQNANRTVTMDGVIGVSAGTTNFTYSGVNAGSSTVALNTNAGYLFGSGVIAKGTVNNGPAAGVFGGNLVINESNPLFRGGFNVDGGSLVIKSVGNPTGTGAAGLPINLGTTQVNDLTNSTSKGSPEARLIFQMRDLVDANGGTTATGAFDSFQINVGIPQDIIINRPSDALPGQASTQVKKIGVVGTGLSLDQYNLNGTLHLRDDLQFYVEDTFTNVNANEEYVNFNVNGPIVSDGPVDPNTGLPLYVPTFTSRLNITGRPNGALPGIYNNLYAVVSLNHANPGFIGNLTFGNTQGIDAQGFPISNPDANHVLRLNNDLALNSSNKITLLNDVTLQVPGHNVTIGSLIDNNISGTQTTFSGGLTTGYIVSGAQAIVENGSATPSILTINQTEDNDWRFLIRDGFTVDGARTGSLALVKKGPAIVRIINANDFSGGLTVLDGIVLVRNSGSFGSATGSGQVNVIGAAFGGDNTSPIAGDLTIMNAGSKPGILTPGRITPEGITLGDTLNVSKLKFASVGGASAYDQVQIDTYSDEAGGNNDRVNTTSLDINAPVELVLRLHAGEGQDTFGHLFTPGDPVDLDGEFIRLFTSSDAHIQFGPNGYFIYNNHVVGDGSNLIGYYIDENGDPTSQTFDMHLQITDLDIRLIAVPEPNVGLTLAIGVGALLGLQRFRRRGRA